MTIAEPDSLPYDEILGLERRECWIEAVYPDKTYKCYVSYWKCDDYPTLTVRKDGHDEKLTFEILSTILLDEQKKEFWYNKLNLR